MRIADNEKDLKDSGMLIPVSQQDLPNRGLPALATYALIFAVVAAAVLPMAFMGIPDGFDLMQHMRFAVTYYGGILDGQVTPGWAANDNFGFGSIGIRYYPPLAYYLLAITKMITGSWYSAFWMTCFGWMFLGSVGVYRWIKEFTTNDQATIAAVMYVLAPYHTFQIYQAVLYSEFAAAGILPFCFLFLYRVCTRSKWTDAVLLSIAYSALILTHIPTAIIGSICLMFYGLLAYDWSRFRNIAVKIGSALTISLLATSSHVAKIILEVEWVIHNSPKYFANGYYDYKTYLFPIFFSSSSTKYIEKILWHIDLSVILSIGLFLPLLAIIFLLGRNRSSDYIGRKQSRSLLLTGAFAVFMLSVASTAVWNSSSVLQRIQFPWRWLIIVTLFGSAAFGVVFKRGSTIIRRRSVSYTLVLFVLTILFFDVTQNMIPSTPLSASVFQEKIDNMNNEEGCDCWWPIWAKSEAFSQPERLFAGPRNVTVKIWGDESRSFAIGPGSTPEVRVATFFHPYWMAAVNGEKVVVTPDINGAILIPLPETAATVDLAFEEPKMLTYLKFVSLFTWLSLAIVLVASYFRQSVKGSLIGMN